MLVFEWEYEENVPEVQSQAPGAEIKSSLRSGTPTISGL